MSRFRRAAVATVLALSLAAPALACAPPPYQADFRKHSAEIYKGEPNPVDFASHPIGATLSETRKDQIRASVRQGANFAGSYRLVQFRCGEKCTRIFVVSLKTGKIQRVPVEGEHIADYRQSSKFLVVRSMDESRRIVLFVFDGDEFRPASAES